jgi:amidohydrolase
MQLEEEIKKWSQKNFPDVKNWREYLHAHPELSFKEFNTSLYIQTILREKGIPFRTGIAGTGIVGELKGNDPESKVVLLRADMDALPIQEKNEVTYKSKHEGIMHACGHDVHSACLLGALSILAETKEKWKGTVKFIFQPGEEVLPGGASIMIQEGVLENPKVDSAIALHVFPSMETGKVGFKDGMYMASTDEIYLTIKGQGGHAAMPSEYINPLLVSAEVLQTLNEEFMLNNKSDIPTVLAFGSIEGKGATNVIPEEVKLCGTFRTMNEEWRESAHEKIKSLVEGICQKWNAKAILKIEKGYPFLVNDISVTEKAKNVAKKYLGENNVEELPLRMTAEDFAYFSQKVPSCFFRLGTGNSAKGIVSGVHSATFDVDERCLEIGSGLMAALAIEELSRAV